MRAAWAVQTLVRLVKSRDVILLCGLMCAAAAIASTWDAWSDICAIAARDEESSHVWLAPFVVCYLLWTARHRLANWSFRFVWSGIALICFSWCLGRAGYVGGVIVAWHASAIVALCGSICTIWGIEVFRRFPAAIGALAFLLPLPGVVRQFVAIPLQRYCAMITERVLTWMGTAVERTGNVLNVEGTLVEIAEACTGVRMLMATVVVVYAFCFSCPMRIRWRVLLLSASPLVALFLNSVRLVVTGWLFGNASADVAVGFHDISGWAIPSALFMILLAFDPKTSLKSLQPRRLYVGELVRVRVFPTAVSLVLLLTLWVDNQIHRVSQQQVRSHQQKVRSVVASIPYCVDSWVGKDVEVHDEEIDILRPLTAVRREYRDFRTDRRVTLLTVQCGDARDLVGHEPSVCFVGQGWDMDDEAPTEWRPGGVRVAGRKYAFNRQALGDRKDMRVFNAFIMPGGETTGSMSALTRSASDYRDRQFGAILVQILSFDDLSEAEFQQIGERLLESVVPLVDLEILGT